MLFVFVNTAVSAQLTKFFTILRLFLCETQRKVASSHFKINNANADCRFQLADCPYTFLKKPIKIGLIQLRIFSILHLQNGNKLHQTPAVLCLCSYSKYNKERLGSKWSICLFYRASGQFFYLPAQHRAVIFSILSLPATIRVNCSKNYKNFIFIKYFYF